MKSIVNLLLKIIPGWFACAALAATAEVRVDVFPAQVKWPISRYLLGGHFVYTLERDAIYADGRVADWMKSNRVGVIRWPGGTVVKYYHWDSPSGLFAEDSWNPKFDRKKIAPASEFMDLEEYITFCRRVGCEPMVGINVNSSRTFNREADGIAEAVRCVEHCREKGWKVRWWYLGNEEPAKIPAYAAEINHYAEAMRKADDRIKIIANHNDICAGTNFETLLGIAGKNIDVMEFHTKWFAGLTWNKRRPVPEAFAIWQKETPIFNGKLGWQIQRLRQRAAQAGYSKMIFADNEWGVDARVSKPLDKYQTSLIAVDFLLELFRNGYDMACYWNTQWPQEANSHLLDSTHGYAFNPVARGFELLSSALGEQMVGLTSSDPAVYGFACKNAAGDRVQIFLINKHAETAPVTINLGDWKSRRENPPPGKTMKAPGQSLAPLAAVAGNKPAEQRVALPAFSFSRIEF